MAPDDSETSAAANLAPGARRVLLLEDNAEHQRLLEVLLKKLNVTVVLAENGQQGLAAIEHGEPAQLILLEMQMPRLDGCDATAQIRSWEAKNGEARRAIIGMTANAYEEDRQYCLEVGMDDLLTKPLSIEQLDALLARWLPAATPAANQLLDVARVRALVRELEPLLAHNEFDAIARFRILQEALAQTDMAAALVEVAQALDSYHSDLALMHLRQIAKAKGWEGDTDD